MCPFSLVTSQPTVIWSTVVLSRQNQSWPASCCRPITLGRLRPIDSHSGNFYLSQRRIDFVAFPRHNVSKQTNKPTKLGSHSDSTVQRLSSHFDGRKQPGKGHRRHCDFIFGTEFARRGFKAAQRRLSH